LQYLLCLWATYTDRERELYIYLYIYIHNLLHTHMYIYKYDSLQYIRHCTYSVWSGLVLFRLVLSCLSLSLFTSLSMYPVGDRAATWPGGWGKPGKQAQGCHMLPPFPPKINDIHGFLAQFLDDFPRRPRRSEDLVLGWEQVHGQGMARMVTWGYLWLLGFSAVKLSLA
jgi:hypothetical protein